MIMDYDSGREKLEKLIETHSKSDLRKNEANTRLQMIDTLFFECLGWSKEDLAPEEEYNGDYADYTFLAPRRMLIVEAKREGTYFDIVITKNQIEYSIKTLCRDCKGLKDAIKQASTYCQERGVPYGAVTNGHQIVTFIATRDDGQPPLEGRALVFPSFEFMLTNFKELWRALSKPGVEDKYLQKHLIGNKKQELPYKLSTTVSVYPGVKARNIFQADLQTVSDLIIEDLAHSNELEKRFLEECYYQSGTLSSYSLLSKSILQSRYAALYEHNNSGPTLVPAVNRDGLSNELLAESLSRRPILLLGDVGVGKTSFIRRLIRVDASPLFENAITIYINLGAQATLSQSLKAFIPNEITVQLRDDHEVDILERNFVHATYHGDLERFSKSIYADLRDTEPSLYKMKELELLEEKLSHKEQHIKHSLEHLSKARKKQVVMFLDNADQRDEDTQQEAFLVAQEIAENWPVTVFLALRPETFHRSVRFGALSGYHPKAFTISPPRIDRVIEKRLTFALKLTNGEIPIHKLSSNITVHLSNLDIVIKVLLDSLAYSDELNELFDNLSGGNVRLALDLVRNFFGSGHVDTVKIVKIYNQQGFYYIPLHEILRAVIYGDSQYFDSERSHVCNLFDISISDSKDHFILPLLLGLLSSTSGLNVEEGFMEVSKVYDYLQGLGFIVDQIDAAIIRAYRKKLIQSSGRRIPQIGIQMPQALRVTTIGLYHIRALCRLFTYIDAVIIDTPILDSTIRTTLRNVVDDTLMARLNRARVFRKYLDDQWKTLPTAKVEEVFDWPKLSKKLYDDINSVDQKVSFK